MIELPEEIDAVNGIWIDPGADRNTRIARRREPRVDRRNILRKDCDQAGLIEKPLLEVREVERPVAQNRAAETSAVLLLVHRKLVPGQGVSRIEVVVTDEVVDRAVPGVGSTLRDDIDVPTQRATELRLASGRHHLELFHRVHAVRNSTEPGRIVIG